MENEIMISAVIPVYNVQEYINECLKSIVNQEEPFDEVILINDGSTDESSRICEEYCQKYGYFKLINQQNQGLSCARNIGVKNAIGDYIVFIDSDDIVSPDMVTVIQERLQNQNLDVLFYSAAVQYDVDRKISSDYYFRKEFLCDNVIKGKELLIKSFEDNYIVSACLGAYSKTFLYNNYITFPERVYFEDNVFSLNVLLHAKQVECISNQLYIRRVREDSITTSKMSFKKCSDSITVQMLQWDLLFENFAFTASEIFLRTFITYGVLDLIDKMMSFPDREELQSKRREFAEAFIEKWYTIFCGSNLTWQEYGVIYFMLKEIGKEDAEKYRQRFIEEILKKMKDIPLTDRAKKIGIYGIGQHTLKMFDLYKRYVGNIECDLYYIVSKEPKVSFYEGKPVVLCSEIPRDTDLFVVSSELYQKDMLYQLRMNKVPEEKIVTLYEKNEKYDLVTGWNLLEISK